MSMLGLQSGKSNLIDMADKMLQVKNGIQHTKKHPAKLYNITGTLKKRHFLTNLNKEATRKSSKVDEDFKTATY